MSTWGKRRPERRVAQLSNPDWGIQIFQVRVDSCIYLNVNNILNKFLKSICMGWRRNHVFISLLFHLLCTQSVTSPGKLSLRSEHQSDNDIIGPKKNVPDSGKENVNSLNFCLFLKMIYWLMCLFICLISILEGLD